LGSNRELKARARSSKVKRKAKKRNRWIVWNNIYKPIYLENADTVIKS
jgi:hypothetical protein